MTGFRCLPLLFCLGVAALASPSARAAVHTYRYDTVHSQVLFSISHDGYSRPFGLLHIAHGWLRFDPKDWSTASTELDIDLGSVDMGDADWNKAVCKDSLLDCTQHRYAHFVSSRVERKDDRHGILYGTLTLHGVSKPLSIPFTFNRDAATIFGLHTVAGFSATAALDRDDFGITAFDRSIGHHVTLWLELEAVRDDQAQSGGKQP